MTLFMRHLFEIASIAILSVLFLSGCAHKLDYNRLYTQLQNGECRAAAVHIDKSRDVYGTGAELLYLLDSAMVHLQCENFETAQARFHEAERLAEKLWTESISRQTVSLVTSDYVLKYEGEDYERALINMMSAIGYLQTGQIDDALVECRRLDSLLSLYNNKYDQKNVYKEDAFGRYLSGILNEADGELDDAFIDYHKAYKTYLDYETYYGTPVPAALIEDLLRVAEVVDRAAEVETLLPDVSAGERQSYAQTRALGKVVFIQFSGRAPVKTEGNLYVPTRHGPVTVSFPRLRLLPQACNFYRLTLTSPVDQFDEELALAEDIGRIALKNLDDKKTRIVTKTIARAIAKQVLINAIAENADKNAEAAIKTALNLVNLFLEKADTRSWRTLPGEIYMARLFVPPGVYRVKTTACDDDPKNLKNIVVQAEKTNYIVHDDRFSTAVPQDKE